MQRRAAHRGYDGASYGRDVAAFRTFLRNTAPDTLFLGPGSVGEGPFAMPMGGGVLMSEDLLQATGPHFDVFSYHLYAAASQRCASMGASSQTNAAGTFSRLALATRKDWRILREPSRQVRTGQITLDYGNRRCSLRRKPMGIDFSRHLPISCSTCKPRSAWGESDYAQHAGIKRLRPVGRKYIRTTSNYWALCLATPHGCDVLDPARANPECVRLWPLPSEPSRRRHASEHNAADQQDHEITLQLMQNAR